MRDLRLGKRTGGGLLGLSALVVLIMFVLLPSVGSTATPTYQPPASGAGITPILVANGGQNNDCSFFYPGSAVSPDGTTVTLPNGGGVLHQFYINNPKNTTTATDPATGATFTLSISPKNILNLSGSTRAAIVDIGIKGGVNTTRYNYNGSVPVFGGGTAPGYVTTDSNLHPPIQSTDSKGNITYYTVSHTSFCYQLGNSASGTVYNDANGDHSVSGDSGVTTTHTLNLYNGATTTGTPANTTTTNGSGNYTFGGLTLGNQYTVCLVPPTGWQQTLPLSNGCRTFTAAPNATIGPFGSVQVAAIGGRAFVDANANNQPDSGEGTGGLTVTLYNGSGASLATTTTASAASGNVQIGDYSFTAPVNQAYTVCVGSPGTSYVQTIPTTSAGVSCATEGTRGYSIASLAPTTGSSGDNFGFEQPGSVSGIVYEDVKAANSAGVNGQYDSGTDTPLGGWTVDLYKGSTLIDHTMSSDGSSTPKGTYSFSELFVPNQQYTVCVVPEPTTGPWGQSEPPPTTVPNCTGQGELPWGQPFTPTATNATPTENFGNTPATTCQDSPPFGLTSGAYPNLIKLAHCKPGINYVFDEGTLDGDPWVSVFATDQRPGQTMVPLVQKVTFPYDSVAQNAFEIQYTDTYPVDPSQVHTMRRCQLDPRDPNAADDQTLLPFYQDINNSSDVLPAPDPTNDPENSSCFITYTVNSPANTSDPATVTYWIFSDIDSWTKLH